MVSHSHTQSRLPRRARRLQYAMSRTGDGARPALGGLEYRYGERKHRSKYVKPYTRSNRLCQFVAGAVAIEFQCVLAYGTSTYMYAAFMQRRHPARPQTPSTTRTPPTPRHSPRAGGEELAKQIRAHHEATRLVRVS